jgi:hypothetical protein
METVSSPEQQPATPIAAPELHRITMTEVARKIGRDKSTVWQWLHARARPNKTSRELLRQHGIELVLPTLKPRRKRKSR